MPVQQSYRVSLEVTHEEYENLQGTMHKHKTLVAFDKVKKDVINEINRIIAQDDDFYTEYTKKILNQPPYDKK